MTAWLVTLIIGGPIAISEDRGLPEQATARQTLRDAGLVKVGDRWMLPAEQRIEQQLASFENWQQEASEASQSIVETANRQRVIQAEIEGLQATERRLQTALAKQPNQPSITKRLQQIATRVASLKAERQSPRQLTEQQDVREQIIKRISACNRITLLNGNALRQIRSLEPAYERLTKNVAVGDALTVLGEPALLPGPVDRGIQLGRLAAVTKEVLPDRWPTYVQNGQWRTSLIVEERQATTVTIVRDTQEVPYPAWLPESVLRAAGVEIPEEAPYLEVRLPDGRRIATRVLRLAYLRLGKHQLGGAEILALAPEDADLGGQISLQFLDKHGLRLDDGTWPAVVQKQ